jgi:hypothetical protein
MTTTEQRLMETKHVKIGRCESDRWVSKPVLLTTEFTEAGALPCIYRAFLTEVEAFGVSFEREAGSPVCWKQ